MTSLLLLIDPPQPGAWNMALDEALLERAAETGAATLRLYQWSEPTLSLGYFQRHADRAGHAASRACPLVRRASGGGAIVHHRELTYSFTAPATLGRLAETRSLYNAFHETLVDTLAQWRLAARLWSPPLSTSPHHAANSQSAGPTEPFLCFQRRSAGDVVAAGQKIVGSAQRRGRGAVLQHGSVLLEASPCAPELPGVADLTGTAIAPAALCEAWLPRLAQRLGVRLTAATPPATLATRAAELVATRFASPPWTERR